jgi:hypothetical protein
MIAHPFGRCDNIEIEDSDRSDDDLVAKGAEPLDSVHNRQTGP